VVTLDPVSVERLRAMRAVHAAERLRLGVGLDSGDVLACHEDGTPLRPEALMRAWRVLCKRAEVESLGLHSARHSAVKVLREAGLPDAVIAQRLGHSDAVMASVYGAPFSHQQDAAAAVLGRLLG
jgi:integrase